MKLIFSIILLVVIVYANELDDIESIIKTATIEFKEAKKDNNITKLTSIAQKLYDNHKHIKKLKQILQNDSITFKCNDTPCEKAVLQVGDTLTVIFSLSFDESDEYEKSILAWQLQFGKKIVKNKIKEIYEKGGFKKFDFDINIDESFKAGKYRIAMHHKQSTSKIKEEAFFNVEKPLEVKDIVVSTSKDAIASDSAIYPDDTFYILSGFTLSNPKNKINIDVKLVDTVRNKVLLEGSFIRPKEDNTDTKQLLKFKIPASKLYKEQKLAFSMKLYNDRINPIEKQITIPIKGYKLVVTVPSSLKSGKSGKYKITVPKVCKTF